MAYHVGEFTGRTFGARFGFSEVDTQLLQTMMDKNYMGLLLCLLRVLKSRWVRCTFICSVACAGRKSGKGLFIYESKKAKSRPVNQDVVQLLAKNKIPKPAQCVLAFNSCCIFMKCSSYCCYCSLDDEQMRLRLLSRFTNEAVLIHEEGILANPVT